MNKLFDAITTKDMLTENGMPTHSTSGSFVVDFFYEMGGYRNGRKPLGSLIALFYAALGENPNLAIKALFNLRDPRGGMGERKSGRILWNSLAKSHPNLVRQLLPHIPAFSRWDDLFYLLGTPAEDDAMEFLYHAILSGDKLAAKWTPREGKRGPEHFKKGVIASILRKKWELSPAEYRDLLSKQTEVVETLMCGKSWGKIVFEHVPSQAMKKYRNAFNKHQQERFQEYLTAVESGEKKINTSVLTPVDIMHQYFSKWNGVDRTLEALWKNLPDKVPANISFLPICDVSGSMSGVPMEVSVSLGIYLAQRNKSIFKNGVITFSQNPQLIIFNGKTLYDNMNILKRMEWGMNTNLEGVFGLILDKAVEAKLAAEDLPTHLMIISDMQFDQCVGSNTGGYGTRNRKFGDSALEMIDRMYAEAGYTRPNIFFWNVATAGGIPAKVSDKGTALISGYSPNLLSSVLSGDLNPLRQVEAILNSGRYDFVNEVV